MLEAVKDWYFRIDISRANILQKLPFLAIVRANCNPAEVGRKFTRKKKITNCFYLN
jgi:hypothetical protein